MTKSPANMERWPFLQFFVGDWLADAALSRCTPATRGVWMDLLCAMHQAGRSGELRGTLDQLARVARCSTADLDQALTDLHATGAADVERRNDSVTVTNRRMKREARERQMANSRQLRSRERKRAGQARSAVTPESWQCHADIPHSTFQKNPPPPTPSGWTEEERRQVEEEVLRVGVIRGQEAVQAAIAAGCTVAEVRALVAGFLDRVGLTPGALHDRLMRTRPGDQANKFWPPSRLRSSIERKVVETGRQSRALGIIKAGRAAGKTYDEIVADLAAEKLTWDDQDSAA